MEQWRLVRGAAAAAAAAVATVDAAAAVATPLLWLLLAWLSLVFVPMLLVLLPGRWLVVAAGVVCVCVCGPCDSCPKEEDELEDELFRWA